MLLEQPRQEASNWDDRPPSPTGRVADVADCLHVAGDPTFSHPLSLLWFASAYSHDPQPPPTTHTHTPALEIGAPNKVTDPTIALCLKKTDFANKI